MTKKNRAQRVCHHGNACNWPNAFALVRFILFNLYKRAHAHFFPCLIHIIIGLQAFFVCVLVLAHHMAMLVALRLSLMNESTEQSTVSVYINEEGKK